MLFRSRNYKVSFQKAKNILSYKPHYDADKIVEELYINLDKFKEFSKSEYYNIATFKNLDENKAVYCVKHDYTPKEKHKMDGQKQTIYPRKNWSSLILFNCSHSSNKRLSVDLVNSETGSFLHQFKWLKDSEIGSLDERWNWLEGWTSKHKIGRAHV